MTHYTINESGRRHIAVILKCLGLEVRDHDAYALDAEANMNLTGIPLVEIRLPGDVIRTFRLDADSHFYRYDVTELPASDDDLGMFAQWPV